MRCSVGSQHATSARWARRRHRAWRAEARKPYQKQPGRQQIYFSSDRPWPPSAPRGAEDDQFKEERAVIIKEIEMLQLPDA